MRTMVHLLVLVALGCNVAQGQVISKPDDVTECEGKKAVFTCVLNSSIRSDDVQWYRFIKDNSTTVMVDPNGENIYFVTTNMTKTISSLTITSVIKSYTGYFWVGTPSLNVCNASLIVLTSPPALTVNLTKNITNSSVFIQWDVVDDSLTTTYTVIWTRAGGGLQTANVIEQTSYTITGLTLDTVYTITVTAANMCGSTPEFSNSIILSTNATSNTSSISPTVTASTNSTDSVRISNSNPSSTIVITSTDSMTISTTPSTTTISVLNSSITTTVITTESKNTVTTISNPNIEITTTTFTTTKQFTDTVFLSTSPVKTNMADENSDSSNIPIIAGAAIGGIIVVTIIIVLIIFIFICYFQQMKDAEKSSYNDLLGDDTLPKNIPVALNPLNANDKSKAESSHQMSTTVGLNMTSDIGNKKPPPSNKPLQSTPQNGRIDTQHQLSAEYAAIDNIKKNEDKQQNGERDNQHQPMEYAVVDKSKKKSRKEDKQQNAGTDTKQQQLMEYAVVDKSKKKNKKGDMQQDVEAAHHDDGTIPSIDDHTYANANQNKNNPLLHYADLDTLPSATGAYVATDDSRTPYALVAET